jgi:hypothetical protein
MKRGQVALEFIFIVLLIVIYIFAVTKPLVESSQGLIEDITTVTLANNEAQKLLNSVKRVSMLGEGSKETIIIFSPLNAKVGCASGGTGIGFSAKINQRQVNGTSINPPVALCPNDLCEKTYTLPNGINISCNPGNMLEGTNQVVIRKTATEVEINLSG